MVGVVTAVTSVSVGGVVSLPVWNPLEVVQSLPNEFPELSFVPVVILILKTVEYERLFSGVIVKVLSELELVGE